MSAIIFQNRPTQPIAAPPGTGATAAADGARAQPEVEAGAGDQRPGDQRGDTVLRGVVVVALVGDRSWSNAISSPPAAIAAAPAPITSPAVRRERGGAPGEAGSPTGRRASGWSGIATSTVAPSIATTSRIDGAYPGVRSSMVCLPG